MRQQFVTKIVEHLPFLCTHTNDTPVLLNYLLQERTISLTELDHIRSIHTLFEKHQELYLLMVRKADAAFAQLVHCLRSSNNGHVADVLSENIDVPDVPFGRNPTWFDMDPPSAGFVGRDLELLQLRDIWMRNNNENVARKMVALMVVTGNEGIGKTDLVKRYAPNFRIGEGHCIFINSQTGQSILESFEGLANYHEPTVYDNVPINMFNRNHLCDRYANSKCLFIFDDINDYRDRLFQGLLQHFNRKPPEMLKPLIIVTSRNNTGIRQSIGNGIFTESIFLEDINQEQQRVYFNNVFEIEHRRECDILIDSICELVNGHPGSMNAMATYVLDKYDQGGRQVAFLDVLIRALELKREGHQLDSTCHCRGG